MENLNYTQKRMMDLFKLALRVNRETDYYSFIYFEGDTDDVAISIYKPVDGGGFSPHPVFSAHGLGGSGYMTFEETEEDLSSFIRDNKLGQ